MRRLGVWSFPNVVLLRFVSYGGQAELCEASCARLLILKCALLPRFVVLFNGLHAFPGWVRICRGVLALVALLLEGRKKEAKGYQKHRWSQTMNAF